jgi:hypothetical protein
VPRGAGRVPGPPRVAGPTCRSSPLHSPGGTSNSAEVQGAARHSSRTRARTFANVGPPGGEAAAVDGISPASQAQRGGYTGLGHLQRQAGVALGELQPKRRSCHSRIYVALLRLSSNSVNSISHFLVRDEARPFPGLGSALPVLWPSRSLPHPRPLRAPGGGAAGDRQSY